MRYKSCRGVLIFPILIITWMAFDCAEGFALQQAKVHSPIFMVVGSHLSAKNGDEDSQHDDEENDSTTDGTDKGAFNWLEEWALEGKDAVALMKTQERTQRVMLAQMTEDRIYEITKVLDTLVDEATGQVSEANIDQAKELALQTRNLQKEYKDLVTGAPSTMLETLASLKLPKDDMNKKDGDDDHLKI